MKKQLSLLALGAALVAGGYYYYTSMSSTALAAYTNKQIALNTVDTASVTMCTDVSGHAKLVCFADALKASATPEILAKLQRPYSVEDAKKWSNFPPFGYRDRVGPTLGDLNPSQLALVKAMLKQAASDAADEGYDEIEQILAADEFLAANTSDGAGFASGNYHVALLGTPAATGTWEFYFGGHHLAFGNTYTDGKLTSATPSFRGVEPFTPFQQGGHDHAPLVQEQAAFAAMLTGLSADEQTKAKLAQAYTNIIVGPQQDGAFPTNREGLKVGELSFDKQALVLKAIETYVLDINQPDSQVLMDKYKIELAETYVGFSGTPNMNAENDYVRIDGPSVWIESSMQPGRSVPGVHPHSVWRDKTLDYGGHK
jgi:hypothetical protein